MYHKMTKLLRLKEKHIFNWRFNGFHFSITKNSDDTLYVAEKLFEERNSVPHWWVSLLSHLFSGIEWAVVACIFFFGSVATTVQVSFASLEYCSKAFVWLQVVHIIQRSGGYNTDEHLDKESEHLNLWYQYRQLDNVFFQWTVNFIFW